MALNYPKLLPSALTAESGVNAVSSVINDQLGWLFRRNHNETDFGIDGHIDVVLEDGSVTGQSFAIQIKSGKSYTRKSSEDTIEYDGELKHFNYYANHPSPVLLIVFDPKSRLCYWARFIPSLADVGDSRWTYQISKACVLDSTARTKLLEIAGKATDYLERARRSVALEDELLPFEHLHYAIDRHDVERLDTNNLRVFFQRICSSDKLCRKFQGKVEISIAGYESDARELWEIDQVRKYFTYADPEVAYWFFFLDPSDDRFGLKVYFLCMCGAKRSKIKHPRPGMVRANIDIERLAQLFNMNWPRLNEMTDRLGMSIEENKRISFEVGRVAGFDPR